MPKRPDVGWMSPATKTLLQGELSRTREKQKEHGKRMGDAASDTFHDNAALEDAMFQMSASLARERTLRDLVVYGQVYTAPERTDSISRGHRITLTRTAPPPPVTLTFTIIGSLDKRYNLAYEGDTFVTDRSPVGNQLLGKKKGTRISLQEGTFKVKTIEVGID